MTNTRRDELKAAASMAKNAAINKLEEEENAKANTQEAESLSDMLGEETPEETPVEKKQKVKKAAARVVEDSDEDEVEVIKSPKAKNVPKNHTIKEDDDSKALTVKDVHSVLPDLDEDAINEVSPWLFDELMEYRKSLILEGFSQTEANTAVRNRLTKKGEEINNKYIDEHPHSGVITIDKTNVKELQLTDEEHTKLAKTKAIRLVMVEDVELKNIKVKSLPAATDKVQYIQKMDSSLAHYNMPLPTLGDYVSFRGATTIQLAQNALDREDENALQALQRKASFIYNHLMNSSVLPKYDEEGKIICSFDEFCTKFPYFDVDAAIYAIYVASSPEAYDAELHCNACNKEFTYKIVAKNIIDRSTYPEHVTETIDEIMSHIGNKDYMESLNEEKMLLQKFKSPKTNNIYSIQAPTIAQAMRVFKHRNLGSETENMVLISAMMLQEMLIFDPSDGQYIHISSKEIETMLELIEELNEYDTNLILRMVSDLIYESFFRATTKCPNCGTEVAVNFTIDELVFLRAQDILAGIQE